MKFETDIRKGIKILYLDKELTCWQNENNSLEVYKNNENFDLLFSCKIEGPIGRVGRYSHGIYYFKDKNTHFINYSGQTVYIKNNQLFYSFNKNYIASVNTNFPKLIKFRGVYFGEIELNRKGGAKLFLEDKFIESLDQRSSELKCYDLAKFGKYSWTIDLKKITKSQNAYTHKRIINYGTKLYLFCDGVENRGLLQFDLTTGTLINQLNGCYFELFRDEEYIYTSKPNNILCRIDCRDNSINEWDVDKLIKKNGLESIHDHRYYVNDGVLYFTQSLGDTKAKLVVLDFDRKDLLYKYEFKPQNGAIGSIKATKFKIFVYTQDGLLYIFDKKRNTNNT
ncbi:hypothetical protein OO013_18270 [Mangrovivirga sp. M17]|uniref:DUF5050 domain-containing protein n=1 Tax=Mangrovivirga halotolerans TaxID=2993936 RepID=A0ABT3RVN7_9BACT|nr:hypothetical protein [Mangrovivirga halotolerans]MCX2745834.1 hypothetical protein [Mangrovivirga halotolerans]